MTAAVFKKFKGYGFVHHRALNEFNKYERALADLNAFPSKEHIFEGDLCWDSSEGEILFYFRHPSFVFDTLPRQQVLEGLESGTLMGLKHLETIVNNNGKFIVELKVGRGDREAALTCLVKFLESRYSNSFWFDTFSLTMLRHIKAVSPQTAVSLHTELVLVDRVLVGAPEWPPIGLPKISSLPEIDAITIRRRGGENFVLDSCRQVTAQGKTLLLSRLHSLEHLRISKRAGAIGGYMHGKDFGAIVDAEQGFTNAGISARL